MSLLKTLIDGRYSVLGKCVSALLTLVLVFSFLPTAALAAEIPNENDGNATAASEVARSDDSLVAPAESIEEGTSAPTTPAADEPADSAQQGGDIPSSDDTPASDAVMGTPEASPTPEAPGVSAPSAIDGAEYAPNQIANAKEWSSSNSSVATVKGG